MPWSNRRHRQVLSICLIGILISGCVASPITLDKEKRQTYKNIAVIPIEPSPLSVPGRLAKSLQTLYHLTAVGNVFGLAAGILVVSTASFALEQSDALSPEQLNAALKEQAWVPTAVFAEITAAQLNRSGRYVGNAQESIQPLPGIGDRSITFTMGNWLGAVQKWFLLEKSSLDYGTILERDVDAVIEIGLFYEVGFYNDLGIRVFTKLVDAKSREVVARARTVQIKTIDLERSFQNDAAAFKAVMTDMGGKAMKEALATMCVLDCER